MKFFKIIFLLSLALFFIQCKKNETKTSVTVKQNTVKHAKGFSLLNYNDFSILKVSNPWPNASKSYTYILKKENAKLPDSLKKYVSVNVPIKNIVVTSTTHIPSLEMLEVEDKLIGFPHLDYISSDKVRNLIEKGKIKELGSNQSLNTEVLIDIQPSVIIGYGLDNSNPTLDNLEKSGLKVLLNGDWNEQTPLGKAEWIKLFGALFDKQEKANNIFSKIEKEYVKTVALAKRATKKPTVLAGDIFEGKWYLPQGTSWGSFMLKEANANYLWSETTGTGSLALSFEEVFEKAKSAEFWITSGQFNSLEEMNKSSKHYAQFDTFKNKNVYSFTRKKGKTGGVLYYELAPNRPDIVMKDLVKILHPELLSNYELFFFEKLN